VGNTSIPSRSEAQSHRSDSKVGSRVAYTEA